MADCESVTGTLVASYANLPPKHSFPLESVYTPPNSASLQPIPPRRTVLLPQALRCAACLDSGGARTTSGREYEFPCKTSHSPRIHALERRPIEHSSAKCTHWG